MRTNSATTALTSVLNGALTGMGTISLTSDTCPRTSVPAGGTCSFTLNFLPSPNCVGAYTEADLTFTGTNLQVGRIEIDAEP